ncbi:MULTISPECIES: hypothetical protein [unclassified Streptomyces]|uniref:hypothetical protein n=1 Tax=unclassified Streptomyces TaxID=2593676 RepID=UPI00234B767C|nr:hypothetical protein [Streptomyces sp. M92]WCN01636.1 hypothetical protein M6G08_05905 [Streptomyces sp. M92]
MAETFRSDRIFTLWHYTAAHGDRLLLRAKADATRPRIDLHVDGVVGLLLEPVYRGLVIRDGTPAEVQRVRTEYGVPLDGPVRLHVIGEDRMRGFVVGGPLRWQEDRGGTRDPSPFGPIPGTP